MLKCFKLALVSQFFDTILGICFQVSCCGQFLYFNSNKMRINPLMPGGNKRVTHT